MRSNSDAIMVGVTTAATDDPALTVRGSHHPRVPPARVIVDPTARLPLQSQLVRTARREAPVIVLATEAAPADRVEALAAAGVEVVRGGHLPDWLATLHMRGVRSVLVEGGARLAGALLTERLVDRLAIFHAPIVLGAGALNAFAYAPAVSIEDVKRWRLIERKSLGDDVLTIVAPEGAP